MAEASLDVPDEVVRWAEERAAARARRDFARADELRSLMAEAGWEVLDHPGGSVLQAVTPPGPVVSLVVDLRSWPEDGERFLRSMRNHAPGTRCAEVPVHHAVDGFAVSRNAALHGTAGDIVVFVDTSLELTGDLLSPLVEALADPGVAVAGPYGLVTSDLREWEERTAGEVAAVQGYCLAARRVELLAAGGFRESFGFYRNADIDLSLRLRTLTGEARRAVAVGADRCVRHAHRDWESATPPEREERSRRNMRRVLRRFGDRLDLAVR